MGDSFRLIAYRHGLIRFIDYSCDTLCKGLTISNNNNNVSRYNRTPKAGERVLAEFN
jgi:hypothetical protein